MSDFGLVDRLFSGLLGADVARAYAGDTLVARSTLREEPPEAVEATAAVWVLVTGGRGVVSSSRFLYRVADAWAEAFAAPDFLLRPAYLEELRAAVSRALDAPATVSRERVFVPRKESGADRKAELVNLPASPPTAVTELLLRAERAGAMPIFVCAESDRESAHAALAEGCIEYGRMARLLVRR